MLIKVIVTTIITKKYFCEILETGEMEGKERLISTAP